jgi:hypothetical protein
VVSKRESNIMFNVRNLIPYCLRIGMPDNMKKHIYLLTREFRLLPWYPDNSPKSQLANNQGQQHNKPQQGKSKIEHPKNAGIALTIRL